MACLNLGSPPSLSPKSHVDYRPWLLHHCFEETCAYCGNSFRDIQVDHVVPETYKPSMRLEPTNLLPACPPCNGRAGKSDYHPQSTQRTRLPNDKTGFAVLDPRTDDYGQLFEVESQTGVLVVQPGPGHDRAAWNAKVLLRLDRTKLNRARLELLNLLSVAERLIDDVTQALTVSADGADDTAWRASPVGKIIDSVASRLLFYELFDIGMDPRVRTLATLRRNRLRPGL